MGPSQNLTEKYRKLLWSQDPHCCKSCPAEPGKPVTICVRPEVMKYSKIPVDGFVLSGTVKDVIFVGSQYRTLIVMDNGYEVKVNRVKLDKEISEGERVFLHWDLEDAIGIRDCN